MERKKKERKNFVRYEEIQLGKAAAQVMVLFAERGVKEGQEIT